MNKKKVICTLVILMLLFNLVAYAEIFGGRWAGNLTYHVPTSDPYYAEQVAAPREWDSRLAVLPGNAYVRIYSSSENGAIISPNTVAYGPVGWNASGQPGPRLNSGVYTYADLRVNTTEMDNYLPEKRLAILTHEWGHILGIAHTQSSSVKSIMYIGGSKEYYDKWGIYVPTSFDQNTLDSIY